MDLSDDELMALHSVAYDEVYYGDNDVVYGDGDYAVALRSALKKVTHEAEQRRII